MQAWESILFRSCGLFEGFCEAIDRAVEDFIGYAVRGSEVSAHAKADAGDDKNEFRFEEFYEGGVVRDWGLRKEVEASVWEI